MHFWSPNVLIPVRVIVGPNSFSLAIIETADIGGTSDSYRATESIGEIVVSSRSHHMWVCSRIADRIGKGLALCQEGRREYGDCSDEHGGDVWRKSCKLNVLAMIVTNVGFEWIEMRMFLECYRSYIST